MKDYRNTLPITEGIKRGTVLFPEGMKGWEPCTYYVVDASFASNNPAHRYIFYSGYLTNGVPCGYNGFAEFGRGEQGKEIQEAYFINVVRKFSIED